MVEDMSFNESDGSFIINRRVEEIIINEITSIVVWIFKMSLCSKPSFIKKDEPKKIVPDKIPKKMNTPLVLYIR